VKSTSQIKFWRFAIASFNYGQLQRVLFKAGSYSISPLKFWYIWKSLGELYSNLDKIRIMWVNFNNLNEI